MDWQLIIFQSLRRPSPKPPLGILDSVCHWACWARSSASITSDFKVHQKQTLNASCVRGLFFPGRSCSTGIQRQGAKPPGRKGKPEHPNEGGWHVAHRDGCSTHRTARAESSARPPSQSPKILFGINRIFAIQSRLVTLASQTAGWRAARTARPPAPTTGIAPRSAAP